MPLTTDGQIINLINKSERILLLPSSPPDGDSLGSALSLYLVLKKLGKEVTVVCADPIPEALKFLPNINAISKEFGGAKDFVVTLDCKEAEVDTMKYEVEQDKVNIIITPKKGHFSEKDVSIQYGDAKYDLIITVDTGDLQQLGHIYSDNPEMFYSIPVINIDHHASNSEFGKINMVDITASSTTEILVPLLERMEQESGEKLINPEVATLLLAGIITDTGSFQHSNTTPRAFAVAAHLLDYGARQQEIIKYIYRTKSLSMLRLWGKVLSKIKYDEQHGLVWSSITQEDLQETGGTADESAGIIDELLSNAPGAKVVLLLKEKKPGLVSVSVRTPNKGANANDIAQMFGGGGHPKAAGFRVKDMEFGQAEALVIQKIKEFQEGNLESGVQPHMEPAKIESAVSNQQSAEDSEDDGRVEIVEKTDEPQAEYIKYEPQESKPVEAEKPVEPQVDIEIVEDKKQVTVSDLREDPLAHVTLQKPEVVPAAQPGGEDLLLKDFRNRKNQEKEEEKREERIKDMTKKFFQEPEKDPSELTVEDMLNATEE